MLPDDPRGKDGVLLTDGESGVFLSPPVPYPDGHGFHHTVALFAGSFRGTIEAITYERIATLTSFHRDLILLHATLKGNAQLPESYENFKLLLKGDGIGHIHVRAAAVAGPSYETKLSFVFSFDQTYLPGITRAFEKHFLKGLSMGV